MNVMTNTMANTVTRYENDIVAWAHEQVALIRAGKFELLDWAHIAEEIEDVGKSEQREIANRMAVLLMHLLKWTFQPNFRGNSWLRTIRDQRASIEDRLDDMPSLRPKLSDEKWIRVAYRDAVSMAAKETGLSAALFPETSPWTMEQVMTKGWLPSDDVNP